MTRDHVIRHLTRGTPLAACVPAVRPESHAWVDVYSMKIGSPTAEQLLTLNNGSR